ncbi:YitT family protein [Marinomonas foliarum]|uniref:YitT family protein n=1 Tax=Marinomonas foliarum TaxID=491950 RepID=A0A369AHD4_9GAMM|nr:YitT family protein [Marinomonas foliarum]QRV23263.1 YitT family protein [Marinomonas foliarum]RCX08782.1 putative 5xTM membrane YitT family protein [Marinomonas foliarum]
MKTTHRWLSIVEGCLLVALGIHILNSAGLLISGTAGVSMILLRLTDLSFGTLFFLLNIPFYILAWCTLGRDFTIRTFVSVSLLSALSELMKHYVVLSIHPGLSGALGGLLVGFGLIILFRHNASLGGLNILAVYLERRFSIHASKTTLFADISVLIAAVIFLDLSQLGYSLVAFLLLSSVVGRYHRPPKWAQSSLVDAKAN